MTLDRLIARHDVPLDTKLRLIFLDMVETKSRTRHGRPSTDEELRQALDGYPVWKAASRMLGSPEP